MDNVAEQVVAAAKNLGGVATKKLPDAHRVGVLVDVPAAREQEFRHAIAALGGPRSDTGAASPDPAAAASETKSFDISVTESSPPQG